MQGQEDAAGLISAFAADDRYIADCLADEVLARRPKGTKGFLLQTSILDRMAGPLCDAVTGQEGGQEVLQRLERPTCSSFHSTTGLLGIPEPLVNARESGIGKLDAHNRTQAVARARTLGLLPPI